jgi:hypothetical protein
MFDFDRWGDWLRTRASDLARDGVQIDFHDGRAVPELSLNPSYALNVSTTDRLGFIGFWANGLCDMIVLEIAGDSEIENTAGMEANNATVPELFRRFRSAMQL